MKNLLFLLFVLPLFSYTQSEYLNFDFEETDSVEKEILYFDYRCFKTMLEINRNPEVSFSGNNCLSLNTYNSNWTEGCTIYTSLPIKYCKGLRHVQITLKSRYQFENQNGGFWVFATKGIKYLGKATTYPGYFPFPIIFTFLWKPMLQPVFPYEWYFYKLDFKIDEDPDELLLGFYDKFGRVWYDDIEITLNDKPINNFAFQIIP